MKSFFLLALAGFFLFSFDLIAQAPPMSREKAVRHGCRVIDVHCKCTNPTVDFVVEGQKLGRANPGDPGECTAKKQIDATAGQMPIAYCLGSQAIKDVRKGESKCTATWTCKEPCTF